MATKFPGWTVLKSLSEGGQAHVFLVSQGASVGSDTFVLKSLKNAESPARLARFEQEINAYRKLKHPNILTLVDFGTDAKGRPFLVSEYCEGGSLEDVYERNHPWRDTREFLNVFRQIVRGLSHAHARHVIHRDLKPGNIFLRRDGTPVIGDFGLCFLESESHERRTLATEVIGSRWFAAPEVRNGRLDTVTPAVDIYSLGKVLYWLMSSGGIFDREDHRAKEYNLVRYDELLEPWSCLEEAQARELVNDLLDEMIVFDPAKRIKDASVLEDRVRELRQFIENEARPILFDFPHACTFCRQGRYIFQNSPLDGGRKAIEDAEALGMKSGWRTGSDGIQWMVAVCNMCGNVQLFRPDLYRGVLDRWRRRASAAAR